MLSISYGLIIAPGYNSQFGNFIPNRYGHV